MPELREEPPFRHFVLFIQDNPFNPQLLLAEQAINLGYSIRLHRKDAVATKIKTRFDDKWLAVTADSKKNAAKHKSLSDLFENSALGTMIEGSLKAITDGACVNGLEAVMGKIDRGEAVDHTGILVADEVRALAATFLQRGLLDHYANDEYAESASQSEDREKRVLSMLAQIQKAGITQMSLGEVRNKVTKWLTYMGERGSAFRP